jgi:hypothetical protein
VIVTCFGALDVWTQYIGGAYMGFKLPCWVTWHPKWYILYWEHECGLWRGEVLFLSGWFWLGVDFFLEGFFLILMLLWLSLGFRLNICLSEIKLYYYFLKEACMSGTLWHAQ